MKQLRRTLIKVAASGAAVLTAVGLAGCSSGSSGSSGSEGKFSAFPSPPPGQGISPLQACDDATVAWQNFRADAQVGGDVARQAVATAEKAFSDIHNGLFDYEVYVLQWHDDKGPLPQRLLNDSDLMSTDFAQLGRSGGTDAQAAKDMSTSFGSDCAAAKG